MGARCVPRWMGLHLHGQRWLVYSLSLGVAAAMLIVSPMMKWLNGQTIERFLLIRVNEGQGITPIRALFHTYVLYITLGRAWR